MIRMAIPDPDKDILDALDRQERKSAFLSALAIAAAALIASALVYMLLRRVSEGTIARDGAILIFLIVVVGLYTGRSHKSRQRLDRIRAIGFDRKMGGQ